MEGVGQAAAATAGGRTTKRRLNDILEAFELAAGARDSRAEGAAPGTSAPLSTVANVTHQLFEQMRPTYGMNDTFATVTTSQLIGMGAKTAPAAGSTTRSRAAITTRGG